MLSCFAPGSERAKAIPIQHIIHKELSAALSAEPALTQAWVQNSGFTAKPGTYCLVPDSKGNLKKVFIGIEKRDDFWSVGALPKLLPPGVYGLPSGWHPDFHDLLALAWALGAYTFTRYCTSKPVIRAKLVIPSSINNKQLENMINAIYLVRDWVNTPTENMGPDVLAAAVRRIGKKCGATVQVTLTSSVLKKRYPLTYAVGRAGVKPPRFIELNWGEGNPFALTLIGKGVCYDTGGLNLKTSQGMMLMKKDMAGAAHAISLAQWIMQENLPIQLRVLIPAVENAVSSNSYRPGDVLIARNGKTIEITNTDAEGRLVLADALIEAGEKRADLILDFATLTGAARVALGPAFPALFVNREGLAAQLLEIGARVRDPVWLLPLYDEYRAYLNSNIADISNANVKNNHAGAITAALFLKEFVPDEMPWGHFDIYAYNDEELPGRPMGGEAMALRTAFHFLQEHVLSLKR